MCYCWAYSLGLVYLQNRERKDTFQALGWEKLEDQTKRQMLRLIRMGIMEFHSFVLMGIPSILNPSRTVTLMVSLKTRVEFPLEQQVFSITISQLSSLINTLFVSWQALIQSCVSNSTFKKILRCNVFSLEESSKLMSAFCWQLIRKLNSCGFSYFVNEKEWSSPSGAVTLGYLAFFPHYTITRKNIKLNSVGPLDMSCCVSQQQQIYNEKDQPRGNQNAMKDKYDNKSQNLPGNCGDVVL